MKIRCWNVPDGMYYDSMNAVKRHRDNALLKFLIALGIESAKAERWYPWYL